MNIVRRGCHYRLLAAATVYCLIYCLLWATSAFAAATAERTQIGRNMSVGPNEEVGDVTCIGCSIRIRGHVSGDASTVGGNIFIEDQAQIGGEVTVVAGDVRLDKGVKVAGDLTVVGGDLRRDPQATISGDVTTMGGRLWIVPILLAPFLILGLLIALVVWLIQRARRPSAPAMAA